jgi:hypothetical protein
MRFVERMETPAERLPKGAPQMLPQPPELLDLVSTDHRQREAVAAAERLRGRRGLRARAASLLRELADRLAPAPSLPRGDGELAGRY